jgi:hypothetical protein
MWLLLPKSFKAAQVLTASGLKTRSIEGLNSAECLVPDEEFCVE